MAEEKGRVCVTGAGGYVGSWLVKLLLSKGYEVHGTVRDPGDEKNAHLRKLDKASENLKLFKADLLDYSSLLAAIEGCIGVFHVASPVPSGAVPNPEVELIEPAITGTLNVLKACSEIRVKRVVVVSSVTAVLLNPSWPRDKVKDEACWSDKEYCRATKNWYHLSKTAAESEALEYGKKNMLDVVTVCPCFVFGPMLQSTTNTSSLFLIKILRDGVDVLENRLRHFVDVRDTAEALLLAYEKPEAEGRYICTSHNMRMKDLAEKLRSMYPNHNYPKNFTDAKEEQVLSSEKLQKLGWNYRSLEQTLIDSVQSYQDAGLISYDSAIVEDAKEAEAITVIRGMQAVHQIGIERVLLLMDCRRLGRAFETRSDDLSWGALTLAPDMLVSASPFVDFRFSYLPRSCNLEAHV